ncbi:adenosine receptor A3-like [Orbicella faveolata]|uniref:adenosine receptor A3-like n=1 Tax=Orbicella faveolata TaxID=48498 RepID=UPI0009E1ABCB|nr:adenosine receptor A3-like [Orbicella faveolata]
MSGTSESFCNPTRIQSYAIAQNVSNNIYIIICVVISVMCSVLSTSGNAVILYVLRKCQSLHSPSKALLCSLALTDLFVGLIVLPLFTAYYLTIILEMPGCYCIISIAYGRTSTFIAGVSLQTIATIAIDRYLAFHLRLRYRELVKFRRVVCILVIQWVATAVWSGSWFWNEQVNKISGAIALTICCLVTLLCYLSIRRGLRHHVEQIHQQNNSREPPVSFNLVQYKKTLNNMLWINGLLVVCYMPYLSSLLAILSTGLNKYTRFALHFSAIIAFFNSFLNPFLYCWKIKELKEKVMALFRAMYNFLSSMYSRLANAVAVQRSATFPIT